jgi:hypothetical protein
MLISESGGSFDSAHGTARPVDFELTLHNSAKRKVELHEADARFRRLVAGLSLRAVQTHQSASQNPWNPHERWLCGVIADGAIFQERVQ